MSNLTSGLKTWPWGPVGWWQSLHDRVSRVPACKTSPRAKLGSNATDGAWYSTTALLSGRDQPRCLCVKRLSGSEPKTRRTRAWRPLSRASASPWRASGCGARPLSTANVVGCLNTLICPTSIEHSASTTSFMGRGLSVDHQPSTQRPRLSVYVRHCPPVRRHM